MIRKKALLTILVLPIVALVIGCNILRRQARDTDNQSFIANPDEDITAYAQLCRQELDFKGIEIPPLNCLDGTEIPTLIDGKKVTADQYQQLTKSEIGCDQPSWLDGVGCVNYNFIVTRKVSDTVDLALICRSRTFSSADNREARRKLYESKGDLTSFKNLFYFDSLGMILSNNKTGKTCFFDQVDSVYGGYVTFPDTKAPPTFEQLPEPKPNALLLADESIQSNVIHVTPEKTWKKPFQTARGDRCSMCHDSGPWKHTPWIPSEAQVPPNNKNIPYSAVGPAFDQWRTTFQPTSVNTADVKITNSDGRTHTEPQLCTSCHRIGREATCAQMIDYATGHVAPGALSNSGKSPHLRKWMPPQDPSMKDLIDSEFNKAWDGRYKEHYDALRRCCSNTHAEGCSLTPFGS